jgi:hypothetical protein
MGVPKQTPGRPRFAWPLGGEAAAEQPGIAAKITKYEVQKTEIKAQATALEVASDKANETSDQLNRPHTGMARSLIFLRIAISLASITALTGRRWLCAAAILSALADWTFPGHPRHWARRQCTSWAGPNMSTAFLRVTRHLPFCSWPACCRARMPR